jgi:NhaP-type Na+/H+ or K+/H+ antiporter
MGAGLGFVMGIAFTVIALMQFDRTETNARDVALASLLIGLPFSVLIGLAIGWLWSRFMGPNSL